jgi:hypothetical protein
VVGVVKEKRTFFCSELIAKCLKECHILSPETISSKVFPAHFTDEKFGLKLQEGISIGPEQTIIPMKIKETTNNPL